MFKDKLVMSHVMTKYMDLKDKASQLEIDWEHLSKLSKSMFIVVLNYSKLAAKPTTKVLVFLLKTFRLLIYSMFYYLIAWVPSKRLNRYFSKFFCQYFLDFLGIDLVIVNHSKSEYVDKSCVIISNHPSVVEGFIFPLIFKNLYALVSRSALHNDFFYRIFSAAGHIIMDKSKNYSRNQAVLKIARLLRAGNNIVICPEGKCSPVIANRFYKGAFELAISNKAPIISLYCHYHNPDFLAELESAPLKLLMRLILQKRQQVTLYINQAVYLPADTKPEIAAENFREQYLIWQAEMQKK
jgi:1-acyl-sn-glycerol-3-phosphate acyltransferase